MLLTSGLTRWLHVADSRVAQAAGDLQEHEVLRAMAADALVQYVDLPASASLADMAAAAADPWSSILQDLQVVLSTLTVEIDAAVARNDTLLLLSAPRSAAHGGQPAEQRE